MYQVRAEELEALGEAQNGYLKWLPAYRWRVNLAAGTQMKGVTIAEKRGGNETGNNSIDRFAGGG